MHVIDAAYNVVHDYPGGAESLGPRIGKVPTTLSHEVARTGTAKLGLETAVAVSVMSGDKRILDAFARACGCMVLPLPEVVSEGGSNVLARLGDMLREQSHVVREVSESVADDEMKGTERDRIHREVGELVATATKLLAAVDLMHEQSQARRQGGAA